MVAYLAELDGIGEELTLVEGLHAPGDAALAVAWADELAVRVAGLPELRPRDHEEREAFLVVHPAAGDRVADAMGAALLWARSAEEAGRPSALYGTGTSWYGPAAAVLWIGGAGAVAWLHDEDAARRTAGPAPVGRLEVLPVAVGHDHVRLPPQDVRTEDFPQSRGCGARLPDWDRAVRLTHLPTALTAFAEGQGSKTRNAAAAGTLLRALLLRHDEGGRAIPPP
ncbi:hypothetical protein EDD29_4738 [Actinocorallia herbida]|uniref:Uncharacterized protein n=1 Tax=Actinocorallia herbida TaxID=58109 RepID=A0A3N1D0W6_9ACTN|nr:hypothetical protein [Actinocorallia herbida]ROO87146.1 hypothetical protein EDD29_4738 [Actinocorallia herbida]